MPLNASGVTPLANCPSAVNTTAYSGNNHTYRLHVGTFARPAAVYPPGGKIGEALQVKFIGDPAGDFSQKLKLPLTILRAAGTSPPMVLLLAVKVIPSSLPNATFPVTSVPIRLPSISRELPTPRIPEAFPLMTFRRARSFLYYFSQQRQETVG